MVPDNSTGISRVPAYSGADLFRGSFRVRGSHPLWRAAPCASTRILGPLCRSYNPGTCLATPPVWAPPRSLAATWGIVLTFSSCGYLDVSVPHVRLRNIAGCRDRSRRVAPFGHPRVKGYLLLAVAFRSLSRPSSPPRAKASPMRPCFIPLYGQAARAFGLFSPKPFVPSPTNGDGARCVLLSFLLVFSLPDSGT